MKGRDEGQMRKFAYTSERPPRGIQEVIESLLLVYL